MWMKLLFTLAFVNLISSELTGDHICPEEERYVTNVTRYAIRNITVRDYQWCLQVPPRCSVYTVKAINHSIIEEEESVQLINKCCEGFREDEVREKCIPLACFNCINGECLEDEGCDCRPGYGGPTCEDACDSNHWGKSCRNSCECERGVCDLLTGECVCPPRWNGSRCEICAEGHAEEQCNCICNETTACDLVTGKCTSASGYESEPNEAIDNYEIEMGIADGNENVDFYPPENYRSVHQEAASQKSTTPSEHTTRTPKKSKHMTRKKSTSFPYSYFTSTAIPKFQNPLANFLFDSDYDTNTSHNSNTPLTSTLDTNLDATAIMETVSTKSMGLEVLTDHTSNSTNNFHNAEGDSPEVFTRDYDKNKQELTHVSTEIERPADITQRERKAKAFQMNVPSTNAGHVREERFLNDERPNLTDLPQETPPMNGLVYSVVTAAVVTVAILLLAVVLLACFKLKRRTVKFEAAKIDGEDPNKLSAVSVSATNSIFHTPLPDPPLFENPVFSTPIEESINRTGATFEAHVVCSMNFPKQASCIHDAPDLFYDHPPSTGSYRAASLPEPPDAETEKFTFDPIYDEIPCCKKPAPITSSPSFHTANDVCLYVNTNKT